MGSRRKAETTERGLYHQQNLDGESLSKQTIEQREVMGAAHSMDVPDLRDGIYNQCNQTYYSYAWEGRSCLIEINRSLT